ncbi:RHS repeat protein, partial [Escherichia coli]|nr:RHS repeat protein [Escherichia coli]MIA96373.1 RHS repeat protein [Escherichia coli]
CPQTPATRTRAGSWTRKPPPACCMQDSGRMRNPGCAITGSGITSRKPGCTW